MHYQTQRPVSVLPAYRFIQDGLDLIEVDFDTRTDQEDLPGENDGELAWWLSGATSEQGEIQ